MHEDTPAHDSKGGASLRAVILNLVERRKAAPGVGRLVVLALVLCWIISDKAKRGIENNPFPNS